jgi:predicted nucleotidyltransferase
MNRKRLTRAQIIQALVNAFKPLDYTHAFYEGGAAAFNRVDEWSDIDLYLVVDDDKVDEAFLAFEKTLKSLSAMKQKYEIPHSPFPGVYQAFYRLEDTSEYLPIDLAVLTLSSPDKFLEPEIHGKVVFHFNKPDKVRCSPLDKSALTKKVLERLERLKARFAMFNNFVQKEINRKNYLEALDLYHLLTLATLVEALRMKHNPVHYDFKMRYVHYELPQDVVQRLEDLYFVKNKEDLQKKYREAVEWFHKLVSAIDEENVERLIRLA